MSGTTSSRSVLAPSRSVLAPSRSVLAPSRSVLAPSPSVLAHSLVTRLVTACALVATMSTAALADRAYDPPAPQPVSARRVVGGGVPAHFAQPPNAAPNGAPNAAPNTAPD